MRQILIKKIDGVCVDPANPQALCLQSRQFHELNDGNPNILRLPGLEIVSGAARLRFSVARNLAVNGVFLLGAYQDGNEVEVALAVISGCGPIRVLPGETVLCVDSVDVDALTLVEGDARFRGGVLVLDKPAEAGAKPKRKKQTRKKS